MNELPLPGQGLPARSGNLGQAGAAAGGERLPCGVAVEVLVDQADAGRLEPADAHQAGCAFCRRALRDAAVSASALELLRAGPAPVPPGLVDRVLRSVRRARPPADLLELPGTGPSAVPGRLRVSRQVIADVARTAAAALPGVTVPRAVAALRGTAPDARLHVALSVLVDGTRPLPQLAAEIRVAVRAALARAVSARDVTVELTALDLIPGSGTDTGSGGPRRPDRPELSADRVQLSGPDGV